MFIKKSCLPFTLVVVSFCCLVLFPALFPLCFLIGSFFLRFFSCFLIGPKGGSRAVGLEGRIVLLRNYPFLPTSSSKSFQIESQKSLWRMRMCFIAVITDLCICDVIIERDVMGTTVYKFNCSWNQLSSDNMRGNVFTKNCHKINLGDQPWR